MGKKLLKKMSIAEIEKYGSEVQVDISESMSKLLKDTKCIDLGQTGNYLSELSATSSNITKQLEPKGIFKPFRKAKLWVSRFEDIESSIDKLDNNIVAEKEKLNATLEGLYQSKILLSSKLEDLYKVESSLEEYVSELQQTAGSDDDSNLRLQVVVHRLKVISTTIAVTKQEISKTVLVIQENKEITNQLMEASENLIPMFKTMMNVLATKVNSEAVQLKKSLVKTANRIIIENANQIDRTATDLIEGREESLIPPQTLTEANQILQGTIKKVLDSAKTETVVNLELIQSLKESTKALNIQLPEDESCKRIEKRLS